MNPSAFEVLRLILKLHYLHIIVRINIWRVKFPPAQTNCNSEHVGSSNSKQTLHVIAMNSSE